MNRQHPDTTDQLGSIEIMCTALAIAGRAVIELIESQCRCPFVAGDPHTWWNVEPLTNPHEQPSQIVDMHAECLRFARAARLIENHPTRAGLVRIVHRPT